MRIFIYEHLTAIGLGRESDHPLHLMYREGRAMREAVAQDFRRLPGVEVPTLDGPHTGCQRARFTEQLDGCDWCLVIAPELEGELEQKAQWVVDARVGLLAPSIPAIRLTSDKLALAEHWRQRGVPTPETSDREPGPCEAFPVVWKPRHGAGSTATFQLNGPLDVVRAKAELAAGDNPGPMILQSHVAGRPASVAFLCGPSGHFPLLPASQFLSRDGRFHYEGGEIPLPPEFIARAIDLATRAVICIPGLSGYVGVDLVLGEAPGGSEDFAIEVNPRLTTSYVGLRTLAMFNMAESLLRVAMGEDQPGIRWHPGSVRFAPNGIVQLTDKGSDAVKGT